MADEVGSLEAGKRADIVIRSADCPMPSPMSPIKQLMLVSRTKGVDTVLCHGEYSRHGS